MSCFGGRSYCAALSCSSSYSPTFPGYAPRGAPSGSHRYHDPRACSTNDPVGGQACRTLPCPALFALPSHAKASTIVDPEGRVPFRPVLSSTVGESVSQPEAGHRLFLQSTLLIARVQTSTGKLQSTFEFVGCQGPLDVGPVIECKIATVDRR